MPPSAAGVNFFHRKPGLLAQCGKLWDAHIIGGCHGVCEGQSVFAQKHPQKKASSRNQQPIKLGEYAGKVSWRRVNERIPGESSRKRPVSIGRVCHIHDLEVKIWGARGGAGMGNKFGGYIYAGDGPVCGGKQARPMPGAHPASRVLPGTGSTPRRDQGNISWFHLIERSQRLTIFRRPRPIPAADCH